MKLLIITTNEGATTFYPEAKRIFYWFYDKTLMYNNFEFPYPISDFNKTFAKMIFRKFCKIFVKIFS